MIRLSLTVILDPGGRDAWGDEFVKNLRSRESDDGGFLLIALRFECVGGIASRHLGLVVKEL
jgi:hypothetical protein